MVNAKKYNKAYNYCVRLSEKLDGQYSNTGYYNLEEFLSENHPNIHAEMKNENYNLDNAYCSFIRILRYENKIVGFAGYNFLDDESSITLNIIYILPEFRGNNLFIKELKQMRLVIDVYISFPNFSLIQSLINSGLAFKVNNFNIDNSFEFSKNLVYSTIPLCFYEPITGKFITSNFYDEYLCAVIKTYSDKGFFISPLLEIDMEKHNACLNRESLANSNYIIGLFNSINAVETLLKHFNA